MTVRNLIPGLSYRTLCLHGFAPRNAQQWHSTYNLLLDCHAFVGATPEKVTLDDVPGLSNDAMTLAAWGKWLERRPFPIPSSLSVGANVVKGMTLPWLNTRAWGSANNGLGSPDYCDDGRPLTIDGGTFKFFCDAALHGTAYSVFEKVVSKAWSTVPFEYGYAFTSDDPGGFCIGGLRSKFPSDMNALRRRWSDFRHQTPAGQRYSAWMDKQQGDAAKEYVPGPSYRERLRDVFPLNYLVDTHLALPVGTTRLEEWIGQDPARGSLRKLADGLWCWAVDEAAIPAIRRALEPSGLLVAPGGR